MNYWSDRLVSELKFAMKYSQENDNLYDDLLKVALELTSSALQKGPINETVALEVEGCLSPLTNAVKKLRVLCVAHAHIDMNWLWGYSETVAITLDTFRTMLNLLNEYPQFKFSHSQASVYRIVEEYDPDMLQEIKKRVKEGRWEVTASTWVEADKNLPNGESEARQILYTKRYLSNLLDINPTSLQIDFEPDTFGHNQNVPEILQGGGVKYYYHCRGYTGHNVFNWKAPSGSEIIVYNEPLFYNASDLGGDIAINAPGFCKKHGVDTALKLYGVGDHGGGPTRRDIEKLMDMNNWPVFPRIEFGTLIEFFKILEPVKAKLPTFEGELNFVFPGCYSSQTRIKLANRMSQSRLREAETISTISNVFVCKSYPTKLIKESWIKTIFNQFHDILPGSGVLETREMAMGMFQEILAGANTSISAAERAIAEKIDTNALGFKD